MRHDLTDAQLLTLLQSGCNAVEIGDYTGTPYDVAKARMKRVLADYNARTASLQAKTEEQKA